MPGLCHGCSHGHPTSTSQAARRYSAQLRDADQIREVSKSATSERLGVKGWGRSWILRHGPPAEDEAIPDSPRCANSFTRCAGLNKRPRCDAVEVVVVDADATTSRKTRSHTISCRLENGARLVAMNTVLSQGFVVMIRTSPVPESFGGC